MRVSVNWTAVVAALIGVGAIWIYSIVYVTIRDGTLHDDWLHALGVILALLAVLTAWHCLALLVRVARWRVSYPPSPVRPGRGPGHR